MDGYYDWGPTVSPIRALALVGLPGSGVEEISRLVAGLLGLPWFSLDRAVEHTAGCSLDLLVLRAGEDARLQIERDVLPTLLRQVVPPVLALGDTTLGDPVLAGQLGDAHVVWIDRPDAVLFARLRARLHSRPSHRSSLLFGEVDPRVLAPVFAQRMVAMRAAAAERLGAGEREDHAVARELAERWTTICGEPVSQV